MISSPMLRMMLAMYLALWSPALCCCAIKSGVAHVIGIDGQSGMRSCCSQSAMRAAAAPAVPSCPRCAANAAKSNLCAQPSTSGDTWVAASQQDGHCKCHERSIDAVRLDTGGRISMPALSAMLGTMLSDLNGLTAPHSDVLSVQVGIRERAHPPPSPTLLAQHCSLVV